MFLSRRNGREFRWRLGIQRDACHVSNIRPKLQPDGMPITSTDGGSLPITNGEPNLGEMSLLDMPAILRTTPSISASVFRSAVAAKSMSLVGRGRREPRVARHF